MSSVSPSDPQIWYATARFQTVALWVLVAIAVAEGVVAIALRDNDFLWHCHHGAKFLAGIMVRDHYLPARGLMDSALTFAPYLVTRSIAYAASLLLLLVCCRLWNRLAPPAPTTVVRAAGFFSVVLLLPYLLRDLDECGLQIFLLFFLTMAGYALSQRWAVQTGFWLATAACYKATPLLFLPILLWKRQWLSALWTVVFLALWCLAPALYTGWDKNIQAHELWLAEATRLKAARQAYPSLLDREPPEIYNLSLYAGIARFLESVPPGHSLYVDDPWFVQFGDLDQATAYYVLHGILAVLGLGYFWITRRPWAPETGSSTLAGEWATLCAFCALLSPLCWKHHFVLVLPCAFLQFRSALNAPQASRGRILILVAIGAVVYGCRPFVMGASMTTLLLSYKLDTLAMVVLVCWTLVSHRNRAIEEAAANPMPTPILSKAA